MGPYLGDYAENATVYFMWDTNDADGASITRATDGTISVYKADNTTQSVAGITDTEDFDSLTGIHSLKIDTSADAFYATGNDYNVVLSAATIDGQTVNAVLCTFSIENRFMATVPTAADIDTELSSVHGAGSWEAAGGGTGAQTVTITVQDQDSNPIDSASVAVHNSNNDDSPKFASGSTDSLGQVTYNLDNGTYSVRTQKAGYNSDNVPETLVVSGSTSDTYGMTDAGGAAPSPDVQALSGNVQLVTGTNVADATVEVKALWTPQFVSDALLSTVEDSTTTNASGNFTINVIRAARIRVLIKDGVETIYDREITVTSDATRDLSDYE